MQKLLIFLSLVSFEALSGDVSRETSGTGHSYDIAIDYCSSRGGLALYSVQGDVVKFSCADEISVIITITTD